MAEIPSNQMKSTFDLKRENLKRYVPAAVVGSNLFLVLVNIFVLSLLPSLASQIVTLRSEILAYQLQMQSAQKLAVDLASTQEEQETIRSRLPTKSRLLEVIEVFESLKDSVTLKNFAFEGELPQPDTQGFAYLPLTITLEGSLSQTMAALARVENAPFILTVEQAIIESPEGLSQNVRLSLLMRLYVSEPFAQVK